MSNRAAVESNDNSENECFRLLKSLKQTVEWLLSSYSPNVWNTYGSLPRLCSIIDDIFTHGLLYEGPQKYWEFLCELFLLRPEFRPTPSERATPSDILSGSQLCNQWLEKSLQEHNLSMQLQMLIKDEQNILSYYKKTSFLCNKSYTNALVICLRAVEHNQPVLLSDLDPYLIMKTLHQSQIILNSPMDIPSIQSKTSDICDNTKEVYETSSSLDYATPPEYAIDLICESKIRPSHLNLCHQSLDKDASHLNYNCKELINHRVQNHLQEVAGNISNYSIQNGCCSVANCSEPKCISSTVCNNKNIISSNPIATYYPYTFSPIARLEIEDAPLTKRLQRSASDPAILRQTSPVIQNCSSIVSLSAYIDSKHRTSSKSLTQRNTFCPNGSCSDTCPMTSSTSTVCDLSSQVIKAAEVTNSVVVTSDVTEHDAANISTWKAQHSRSKSDGTAPLYDGLVPEETETVTDAAFSMSLPNILPADETQRKSIFDDDQVPVPTECYFPRPQPGQTLTSFLSSNDFNICAELDKENAHFYIADALISAIEQIKCTSASNYVAEEVESDEEIQKLTQRIRIRRREKMREKEMKSLAFFSDGLTDTTTSQSASPKSSSHSSEFDAAESIGSDEYFEDFEISDRTESNLSSMKESGLSLSMASLYSDADIKKVPFLTSIAVTVPDVEEKRSYLENNCSQLSAEAIALSLLKRFSEKQLPKASDLHWLVSEQDAPQQLLPLPDSWPISPDSIDEDCNLEKTRLRGNLEWAPPRRQIIFTIHPDPKRKSAIQKQNFCCAGCGMKIEKSFAKKFRYCDYLGKFFCNCCHSNNLSYIPGRILWKWDFKNYYVSKFSWKLLNQMLSDPLFNVTDVNPNLYRKVRQLDMCREYRTQLFYLKDFINTCRTAKSIQKELDQQPQHIINEPDLYSISDFIQVKSGQLSRCLSTLVSRCVSHVTQCILCQAKGFICENCNKEKDVIFPFQLTKVCLCPVCGSCFHKKCFKSGVCPKCIRIQKRKRISLQQETSQSVE